MKVSERDGGRGLLTGEAANSKEELREGGSQSQSCHLPATGPQPSYLARRLNEMEHVTIP